MEYEQNGRRKLQQYCQKVDMLWKYFNVLQHEQDKIMLCIKQYRLWKIITL